MPTKNLEISWTVELDVLSGGLEASVGTWNCFREA
jgi:hypothetical protein